jgi:hypothetical protein
MTRPEQRGAAIDFFMARGCSEKKVGELYKKPAGVSTHPSFPLKSQPASDNLFS